MTSILFTKMHGLGNDFVVINNLDNAITLNTLNIPLLSDRRLGIGFDQLLILETTNKTDFFCRIFNADGSEAEQCGNGLRCLARYIHENKLHSKNSFSIGTVSGIFPISIKDYQHIQVTMNVPEIKETAIEINHPQKITLSILFTGNPHAITVVESLENLPAEKIASQIADLAYFKNGANVGFMQILSPNHIRLRTIERGAGETPACGSNACAAVTAGIINNKLANKVKVDYQWGSLDIEWQGKDQPILMTGPAETVFVGTLNNRH